MLLESGEVVDQIDQVFSFSSLCNFCGGGSLKTDFLLLGLGILTFFSMYLEKIHETFD